MLRLNIRLSPVGSSRRCINARGVARRILGVSICMGGLLLLVGEAAALNGVNFVAENRQVLVSVTAPAPPALSSPSTATNTVGAPFGNSSLSIARQIDWPEVDGWTASATLACATQSVFYSANQLTVSVDLVTHVGGDPYSVHYSAPSPGQSPSGEAYASSLFSASFNVSAPTTFEYALDFGITPTLLSVNLRLTSLGGLDLPLFATGGFMQDGDVTLMPGEDYVLIFNFLGAATGDKFGNNSGVMEFAFTPQAVPEPQVMTILTMGALLIFAFRRRVPRGIV